MRKGGAPIGPLLRVRDFRLLLLAWGFSMFGDWVAFVALVLRVQESTGSGLAVAALLLALGVPAVVLNPLAGWLVDHFEATRLLAVTALCQAGVAAALASVESPAATIALVSLLGAGVAIEKPALFALLPRLAGEEHTGSANAWLEASRYTGLTLGTLCGGLLTAAAGASAALWLDSASFAAVAVTAVVLRARRPPAVRAAGRPGLRALTAGFRTIAENAVLRVSVLVLGSVLVFSTLTNVAEVFYAKEALGAGDAGYGALASAWGAGMVIGALGVGRRLTGATAARAVTFGSVLTGTALVLASVAPTLAVALVLFFMGGAANATENVGMRTLVHALVPDELLGRAFAAYEGTLISASFMAMAMGGLAVEWLGPRGTIGAAGAGAIVVGSFGILRVSHARRRALAS